MPAYAEMWQTLGLAGTFAGSPTSPTLRTADGEPLAAGGEGRNRTDDSCTNAMRTLKPAATYSFQAVYVLVFNT